MNDSAYPLNAQIIDRAGRHLALVHLAPGQLYIYDASQGAFDANINATYTPFTVIFLCDSGRPFDYSTPHKPKKGEKVNKSEYINQFGVWTHVPRGSTVNALGCPAGTKSCVMKRNQRVNGKKKSGSRETEGSNAWSNDGGSTWTNDASSGESCSDWGGCMLRDNRLPEAEADSTPWLNKGEKEFETEQGESFKNDDNQEFKNDKSSKKPFPSNTRKKQERKSPSAWTNDGGETWTNDQESHTPSKATPLPFQSRTQ